MTYVGVKCLTRHVVFYVTHELVVQRREDHGIYEDLNLTPTYVNPTGLSLRVFVNGNKHFLKFRI